MEDVRYSAPILASRTICGGEVLSGVSREGRSKDGGEEELPDTGGGGGNNNANWIAIVVAIAFIAVMILVILSLVPKRCKNDDVESNVGMEMEPALNPRDDESQETH